MLTLLAALLLTAEPVCRVNADCVIVVNCGCGCCGNGPEAVNKAEAHRIRSHCATVGPCVPNTGCETIACEPPADPAGMRALCKANQCVMVPNPKVAKPSKKW